MSAIRYVGHGVEIEDDAIRLRRRMVETSADAARLAHQGRPRRLRRAPGPARVMSALGGRRR